MRRKTCRIISLILTVLIAVLLAGCAAGSERGSDPKTGAIDYLVLVNKLNKLPGGWDIVDKRLSS